MGSNPVESPEFFRFTRQLLKLSSKCEDHIFIWFLNEDIFSFKDNTDPLKTKLLLLEGVDFQLSHNGKLIIKMKRHQSESDENVIG